MQEDLQLRRKQQQAEIEATQRSRMSAAQEKQREALERRVGNSWSEDLESVRTPLECSGVC